MAKICFDSRAELYISAPTSPIIFCASFENAGKPQMSLNATIFFDVVDLQSENWFDLRTSTFRPPKDGEINKQNILEKEREK